MRKDSFKEKAFKCALFSAKHAFFACLVIFLLTLAGGFAIFYKNYISIQSEDFSDVSVKGHLDEESYDKLKSFWRDNEARFNAADTLEYPDIFSAGD
ncbi:MAG: hypothetical protein A2365_02660 [Candidatus Nealsonbacteria bacterium RIFOXYB1_FULL_40_15]|uniref:Uncharacterized protein n=2 Tax=Candidatus Nealsoniibacteriota TaxID=1817911 RepID=A0A1G2EP01_9BACT|nr:MAG: hypothetical protein A2365_02660 [Candidatus Nealsonbacteria bacterium RIFOXYB1_FULL_40_15]OGZ27499.1 MAG: hypothetical protein A2427_01515 [Candidatus Nealsonbacteria bacterium RIFOXYC1_FULL_40_7]OGZ28155.1 MAG: hypothetical protein A2562_02920 [Candidatus Nealsonbacteria bacterium RIFOXYD1_FULL_39_11]